MARIAKVYPDLVRDLELKGELGPLTIQPEVFGVILLDSLEEFTALSEKAKRLGHWFTQGVLVAPALGTVLADTGALPIAVYDVRVLIFTGSSGEVDFQWRNAANAVTLRSQTWQGSANEQNLVYRTVLQVETANERFRLIMGSAGVAATDYQGSLLVAAL